MSRIEQTKKDKTMSTTTTTRPQDHPAGEDAPAPRRPTPRGPSDGEHPRTIRAAVVAVVLLAVVAAAMWVTSRPTTDQATDTATTIAVSEDEALRRLIARGYVPGEAFDRDAITNEAPPGRVTGAEIPPPLYTPEELEMLRLVRIGVLPDMLLDGEVFVTKRLIARGLVPAGSAR